jgi:hypothetical protein
MVGSCLRIVLDNELEDEKLEISRDPASHVTLNDIAVILAVHKVRFAQVIDGRGASGHFM